jgi:hypothetical protein
MLKKFLWVLYVLIAITVLSVAAMVFRTPTHDRNWKTEHRLLPLAEIVGDEVKVRNVRDFAYHPDGRPKETRYRDMRYRLSEVETLWYGISHFGPLGLGHTFLSFGFDDGRYLAISFEARQEVGQHYNPILGIFGAYGLMSVAGEERDVIGLRSHIRGEKVYLYQIDEPRHENAAFLKEMLNRINQIYAQPEFYHTITDNCAVSIWRYSEFLTPFERYTHPNLLLPGYSDKVAYNLGLIRNDRPFEAVQKAARIHPSNVNIDDPAFSAKIRGR